MPRATVEKLWQEWADNAPPDPADDVVVHPTYEARGRERVEEVERQLANALPQNDQERDALVAVAMQALNNDSDWKDSSASHRAANILKRVFDSRYGGD